MDIILITNIKEFKRKLFDPVHEEERNLVG